jgi:signal transduction histidine kinase
VLYYLFLALIVRSAVSVPRALSQLALNLTLCACYVLAGFIEVAVAQDLDSTERGRLGISMPSENPAEPLLLRLVVLLLMTVCAYALQVLLDRQRRAVDEARQFALREGQLHAAGRLAAEFAHQIKNPLAIINNAAYSLRRAVKAGHTPAEEQIQIIQEEVERSDRIITQIMGYAQLSEGRVERLSVTEELERAIAEVFPPAARYPVRIHRDYAESFPPLVMHRRHLTETFANLLQNAREALDGQGGNVYVSARQPDSDWIEVEIRDDGPGIPADKHEKVFEAYYTSKEKGTGLGLATVKHNVELYGGTVRLESELGKGARFILLFPARTQIN